MEFANGNYALLDAALDYENDTTPPTVTPVSSTGSNISPAPYSVTFAQSEAADIWYTTDGSTPTESSAHYGPALTRGQPVPIPIGGTTTLRWLAKDFKGNVSTGSQTFYLGTQASGGPSGSVPATLAPVARHGAHVRRVHAGPGEGLHGGARPATVSRPRATPR